jgi:hypothetical protein
VQRVTWLPQLDSNQQNVISRSFSAHRREDPYSVSEFALVESHIAGRAKTTGTEHNYVPPGWSGFWVISLQRKMPERPE